MTCRCGKPADGWPDGDGGELCQMCWEQDCSQSWWRMATGVDPKLYLLEPEDTT